MHCYFWHSSFAISSRSLRLVVLLAIALIFSLLHRLYYLVWSGFWLSLSKIFRRIIHNKRFLLVLFPLFHKRSALWGAKLLVVLAADYSIWMVDLCSSSRVTKGLLAAFPLNTLLEQPVSLEDQPCFGRLAVGSYSFHFLGILFYNLFCLLWSSEILPWTQVKIQ